MRFFILSIVTLISTCMLMGQSSRSLIQNIESQSKDKSKVLTTMEAEILKITQADFPSWNILSVSIHPTTGEITVTGTDQNGQKFSYSGREFGNLLSSSSPHFKPKSASSASPVYGYWACLRRRLAGLSCDPSIKATKLSIPESALDSVEKEYRRRWLIMVNA